MENELITRDENFEKNAEWWNVTRKWKKRKSEKRVTSGNGKNTLDDTSEHMMIR